MWLAVDSNYGTWHQMAGSGWWTCKLKPNKPFTLHFRFSVHYIIFSLTRGKKVFKAWGVPWGENIQIMLGVTCGYAKEFGFVCKLGKVDCHLVTIKPAWWCGGGYSIWPLWDITHVLCNKREKLYIVAKIEQNKTKQKTLNEMSSKSNSPINVIGNNLVHQLFSSIKI